MNAYKDADFTDVDLAAATSAKARFLSLLETASGGPKGDEIGEAFMSSIRAYEVRREERFPLSAVAFYSGSGFVMGVVATLVVGRLF